MSQGLYMTIAIAIMALVTYIPRAIPVAFIHKKITNRFVCSFLYYVPYAVLAAITFPSVFYFTGYFWLAVIGTGVALLLAFFKQKLYIVALVSVLAVYGFSWFFF